MELCAAPDTLIGLDDLEFLALAGAVVLILVLLDATAARPHGRRSLTLRAYARRRARAGFATGKSGARYRPVWLSGCEPISSGVPSATI